MIEKATGESAAPAETSGSHATTRLEWSALLFLVLLGLFLRGASPHDLAVEHFDEGVYASNLWFTSAEGGEFPNRHLYAPPLLPWLVEWSIVFLGPGAAGCFTVGIVTGTATIVAVWWVARRWFGPPASLMAAFVASLSGSHVLFSRTCLTDAPLCLPWALSLGFLFEGVVRNDRRFAVGAGVCVALAWWTKYNGWLPLAIGLSGIAAWLITARPGREVARRAILVWGIAAATAIVLWSPVWWGLQDRGGYSAVAANHAGYFHGLSGWWPALRRQLASLNALDFGAGQTLVAFGVGLPIVTAVALMAVRFTWNGDRRDEPGDAACAASPNGAPHVPWKRRLAAGTLAAMACLPMLWLSLNLLGPAPLLLAGGLLGIALAIVDALRNQPPLITTHALAAWLAAAWCVAMLVLAPLYHPYPRLMLPWVVGSCVAIGGLHSWSRHWVVEVVVERIEAADPRAAAVFDTAHWFVIAAMLIIGAVPRSGAPPLGFEPRTGIAAVAGSVKDRASEAARESPQGGRKGFIVYVFAEPAVFYHLRANGVAAGPVADLSFAAPSAPRLPVPTFLVVGPHAQRIPDFIESWKIHGPRFDKVAEWDYHPSLLVLLDHYDPSVASDPAHRPVEKFELYRLR